MTERSNLLRHRRLLLSGLALTLAGCALPLPDKPERAEPWDLGPLSQWPAAQPTHDIALALIPMEAPSAIDSTRVMYRLLYAGGDQQPRPYAQARWLMSPAQLLEQRLRTALSVAYPIVDVGTGMERLQLQVDLEEFAQFFTAPDDSEGVVRVRATMVAPHLRQRRLLGQRTFIVRSAAVTPDAAGGVRALRAASDELIGQLTAWVDALARQLDPPPG